MKNWLLVWYAMFGTVCAVDAWAQSPHASLASAAWMLLSASNATIVVLFIVLAIEERGNP